VSDEDWAYGDGYYLNDFGDVDDMADMGVIDMPYQVRKIPTHTYPQPLHLRFCRQGACVQCRQGACVKLASYMRCDPGGDRDGRVEKNI
jgi:hypothetical protein